jgi:cysteine synthase B
VQANGANGAAPAYGAATFPTIEDYVGETPLVRLQRLPGRVASQRNNVILAKLEGNNPAGSVKDRCRSPLS